VGHIPVAKPSPIPRWSFPRRGLVIALVLAALVALVAVTFVTAYPTGSKIDNGPVWNPVATTDQLQAGEPVHVLNLRLWIVKLESGEVLALSSIDPRNGCAIPWRPEFTFDGRQGWFRDPCHSSTYDLDGARVFGPSAHDMHRYDARVTRDKIEVRTGGGKALPLQPPPDIAPPQ
jgi:Rieske Fe-S protein